MADIFVSYTKSDRDWAFWLAAELKELGHTPRIHEWEIKSGDDIYAWMETHHDAADHVLCVVSDEYLKAPYSTLESRLTNPGEPQINAPHNHSESGECRLNSGEATPNDGDEGWLTE
jgi:hypothetical protein